MTSGLRKNGEFCWINMLTPEPNQACRFFGELLGWTYGEIPGLGHLIKVAGHDIGGLFDLNGPNTPPGTRAHIGVMVKVESADAIVEKATSLGGKARPAFDIMENGRMSVCHDPNGAEFDVWEPKKMAGTDVDSALHGAPSWFETLTTDVDRAAKFYSSLFGWQREPSQIPGMQYTHFKQGGTSIAGMMPITPQMGAMRPHWGTYFTVNDIDGAAQKAMALGAKLCVPVTEVPTVGRFCGINSPQGVMFYAMQYAKC